MDAVVADGEARLALRREQAEQAKRAFADSLRELQQAQDGMVLAGLQQAIALQRNVEAETLSMRKNVGVLQHCAVKWKGEQQRLHQVLEGLHGFEEWALTMENELQAIAGNLEYVSAVLERESSTAPVPPRQ